MARVTNKVAREWAGKFIGKAASAGFRLDYSFESLGEVDRLLEEQSDGGEVKPDGFFAEDGRVWLFACGCYVGEVLRRRYGGFWRGELSEFDSASLCWVGGGRTYPMAKVLKRVENGPEDSVQGLVIGMLLVATLPEQAIQNGLAALQTEHYKKAIVCLDGALRAEPTRAEARFHRGRAYRGAGNPRRALRDFTRCLEAGFDPVNALVERGEVRKDLKQYRRAQADFTRAIELDPKCAAAYLQRGSLLYHYLDDLAASIADYSRAIELEPTNCNALGLRALAYLDLEEYDKALGDRTEVIRLEPGDAADLLSRAEAYQRSKRYGDALRDYADAFRIDPAYDLAYQYRGWLYEELGQYDRALADFAMAVALDPESGQFLNDLARFWAKCPDERFRDPVKAVECGKRACERTDDEAAYETLAAAYFYCSSCTR